jgi:propanediol dehydratase small subunit
VKGAKLEQVRKQLIVRAYELARTGRSCSNTDIRQELEKEGYSGEEIARFFDETAFNEDLEKLRNSALRADSDPIESRGVPICGRPRLASVF